MNGAIPLMHEGDSPDEVCVVLQRLPERPRKQPAAEAQTGLEPGAGMGIYYGLHRALALVAAPGGGSMYFYAPARTFPAIG